MVPVMGMQEFTATATVLTNPAIYRPAPLPPDLLSESDGAFLHRAEWGATKVRRAEKAKKKRKRTPNEKLGRKVQDENEKTWVKMRRGACSPLLVRHVRLDASCLFLELYTVLIAIGSANGAVDGAAGNLLHCSCWSHPAGGLERVG